MVRLSSLLITLAWWGYRRSRLSLLVTALILGAILALLPTHRWGAPLSDLLPASDPDRIRLEELARQVGPAQDLVVLVRGLEAAQRKAYIDRLARQLRHDPDRYDLVLARLDLAFLRPTLLYHLGLNELTALEQATRNLRPLVTHPEEALSSEAPPNPNLLKLAGHYLGQLETSLKTRGRFQFQSPMWSFADPARLDPRAMRLFQGQPVLHYNTLEKGEVHVLLVRPGRLGQDTALLGLRYEASRIARQIPGIRADVTGVAALLREQSRGMLSDLSRAGMLALGALLVLFGLVYRDLYRPLVGGLASLLGAVLLFMLLAPNAMPAALGCLVGWLVGLCFALRLACSYSEQRRKGSFPLNAWRTAMLGPGKGYVGAVLTLGTAFLALFLTGFPAAMEIGLGGAIALLGSLLGTLVLLPGFLGLYDPNPTNLPALTDERLRRVEHRVRRQRPGVTLAAGLLLSLGALTALTQGSSYLNDDPVLVIDSSLPAAASVLQLERNGHSCLHATVLARDAEHAREIAQMFKAQPLVGRVDSLASLLPPEAEARAPLVGAIRQNVAGLKLPAPRSEWPAEQMLDLAALAARFEARVAALAAQNPELAADILARMAALKTTIPRLGPGPLEDGLLAFEQACRADLSNLLTLLSRQTPVAPTARSLPRELQVRGLSQTGQMVVRIYPKQTGYEPEDASAFVASLKAVDPQVTGPAVLLARLGEYARRVSSAAAGFVWLTLLMVLILRLGSFWNALLAMLPPTLAWFWTAGFLAVCQVPLNLLTFLLPPVLLGLGATLAVESQRRRTARGGRPLLMSVLAVALVAGSLGVSANPALANLGLVLSVSLLANWLAAASVPPLRARARARVKLVHRVRPPRVASLPQSLSARGYTPSR